MGVGGPCSLQARGDGLQKVQLVGLFDGRRSQESSPLLPRLWLAWGAALHSALVSPLWKTRRWDFPTWPSWVPQSGAVILTLRPVAAPTARHLLQTPEEGGAGWVGGAGWGGNLLGRLTSETQLDLPRQRRKRGEGSPTQAPQKKGDRLRFLEQSFLEQRQEEAAEIPLDLSAPKTSQEWPLFRSRKIC